MLQYQESCPFALENGVGSGTFSKLQVFSDRRMDGCCSLEHLLAYVVPDALELGLTSSKDVTRQFTNFFYSLHDALLNRSAVADRMDEYMFHDSWLGGAVNRFKFLLTSKGINKKSFIDNVRLDLRAIAKEMIDRTSGIVRNLQDTCYVLGYKRLVNWDEVFIRYFCLDMADFSIANLKYHSLWLSCRLINCYPKRKTSVIGLDGFLIDYKFRKTCAQIMDRNGSKSWLWSETLLQGLKRGFPSMSSSQARAELKAFAEEMEKPLNTTEELIVAVMRTANELFSQDSMVFPDRPFVFSHSAGVGAPCSDFGMYGALLRNQGSTQYSFSLLSEELVMMYEEQFLVKEVRSKPPDPYWQRWFDTLHSCRVQTLFNDIVDRRKLIEPVINWDSVYSDHPALLEHEWKNFTRDELDEYLNRVPFLAVQSAGIFEPLKLRVITKGDPEFYSLLKPLQVSMWDALRRVPNFCLIGERLGLEALEQLVVGPGGRMFESGDYVGSTNNLSLALTMAVVEMLPTQFLRDMATLTVGPQFIVESAGLGSRLQDGEVVKEPVYSLHLQRRGQLMGSPISFPILCIINAAVARLAFEKRHRRSFSLEELPFLVNGDDFVARWDEETHDIWENLVKMVGWELSPGKSFFSGSFVQINSESKKVRWLVGHDGFERPFFDTSVPYVNMGFVEMLGKDVQSLSDPVKESFSPSWEERFSWLRNCGRDVYERSLDIFRRNLDDIRTRFYLSPPSISLPSSMGGLGIPLDYPRCSFCVKTELRSVYKRCPCCLNCSIEDYTPFRLEVYKMTPVDAFWEEITSELEMTLNDPLMDLTHLKEAHQWSGYTEGDAYWHQEYSGWEQVDSWMDAVEALREPRAHVGLLDSRRLGRVPTTFFDYVNVTDDSLLKALSEGRCKLNGGLKWRYELTV